ncbi:MAG: hypothetical protein GEU91_19700 [Rhizobiales bacterium]|nr:hypothetical protein [Hyphomicrobiales bacterium]
MSIALAVVYLAIAGAVVCWIVGAVYFARALAAIGQEDRLLRWLAIVAWPFARGRFKGAAAGYADVVNKALVAFIACIIALVAATAVATNLARIAK